MLIEALKVKSCCLLFWGFFIRFLKGNSDSLKIDPNFIVVQGYSSGGHLAAFMGTTSGLNDFIYRGKKKHTLN